MSRPVLVYLAARWPSGPTICLSYEPPRLGDHRLVLGTLPVRRGPHAPTAGRARLLARGLVDAGARGDLLGIQPGAVAARADELLVGLAAAHDAGDHRPARVVLVVADHLPLVRPLHLDAHAFVVDPVGRAHALGRPIDADHERDVPVALLGPALVAALQRTRDHGHVGGFEQVERGQRAAARQLDDPRLLVAQRLVVDPSVRARDQRQRGRLAVEALLVAYQVGELVRRTVGQVDRERAERDRLIGEGRAV